MSDLKDEQPTELWTVWRSDDNGNAFVVREHLPQEDADRLVAEFTARGHKQLYWAEREAADENKDPQR